MSQELLSPGELRQIQGFQHLEYLSKGSLATVYEAIETSLGVPAIVKVAHRGKNQFVRREGEVTPILQDSEGFPKLFSRGRLLSGSEKEWIGVSKLTGTSLTDDYAFDLDAGVQLRLLNSYCDRIKAAWSHGLAINDHKLDNFFWDEIKGVQVFDLNGVKPFSRTLLHLTPTPEEAEFIDLSSRIHRSETELEKYRSEHDLLLKSGDIWKFIDGVVQPFFVLEGNRDFLIGPRGYKSIDNFANKLPRTVAFFLQSWVLSFGHLLVDRKIRPEDALDKLVEYIGKDLREYDSFH